MKKNHSNHAIYWQIANLISQETSYLCPLSKMSDRTHIVNFLMEKNTFLNFFLEAKMQDEEVML